jgi:uncharacterized protein YndB with AHSA1/START domain
MDNQQITVETLINAPIEKIWEYWNDPEHIKHWAFASDDWHVPFAENDLKVGGKFKTRMEAKDGSSGFDFEGIYTVVEEFKKIEYEFGGRKARVEFIETPSGYRIIQTFDPEDINPLEMQRAGWQAILDNFKKYISKS